MADLENSDGSKQSLQKHRTKLAAENARLGKLLEEEAEARRVAQAAQVDNIQSMWKKFQDTMNVERESYSRLEESRKALVRFVSVHQPSYSPFIFISLVDTTTHYTRRT